MATIAKGSIEHTNRRVIAMMLRHFAVKYGMTTRVSRGDVEGYDRGAKKWVVLYAAW